MSKAYIAGVGRHLPEAAITFDRFHVIQLANAALEEVRRAEVRENLRSKTADGCG
jgi:Transposase and inactivated derivatives